MALKQDGRLLQLATPLGDNVLLLTGFRGQEQMSRLFRFQLEMISDNNQIAPADIVGKNVTFSIQDSNNSPRYFNGFVSRFLAGDEDNQGRRNYQAEIVPWLWFLQLTSDCRIFQNKPAPDILQQIFGDLGYSDFNLQLSGNHPQRTYCAQYRETDFNFVSRLMEEEGMFYYFKHENGKHILEIADKASAYATCAESEVDYPSDFGEMAFEDHITDWVHQYEFRTGKFAQTDYNFETPSTSLMTNSKTLVKLPGNDKFEYYDYPGTYGNSGEGGALTDVRMGEVEAGHDVVKGSSKCKSFTPGAKFAIRQHRSSSEEGKSYCITAIEHSATEPQAYETGAGVDFDYRNSFTCIPDSVTFRPERQSRKPFVQGVQTAVVVGPAGEEIYTDKYGRVKVQFFWDREGKRDEKSSCWIRVSQTHAGRGFGGIDTPRIGQEVIVAFLEGDPDRPIIVGRVYHAENMPPFSLPDNKTEYGMKSNSTPGGGGYNQISLNDTKNKETITIHAQKDLNATIEHNETRTVVTGTQTVTVKGDTSLTVQSGNRIVTVQSASYNGTAKKAITLHGQTEGVHITGDAKGVSVKGTGKGVFIHGTGTGVGIKGEPIVQAHGTSTAELKAPAVLIEGDTVNIQNKEITIKGTKITLDAGGGMIELTSAGVTITGPAIKSAASGSHDITGALVKIN